MTVSNLSTKHEPEKELDFILKMLGTFYEMSDFGLRDEIHNELEKVKASSTDPVNYFTEIFTDFEKEFEDPNTEESLGSSVLLSAIYVALAHYAAARDPICTRDDVWFHVGWAYIYLGYLRGTLAGRQMGRRAESRIRAVKSARGRHKENRAMKKEAFEFLSNKMPEFKSMNAAAEALKDIVPVTFGTARDWVGEWNKASKNTTSPS